MAVQAYRHGIHVKQTDGTYAPEWPDPYYFLFGSAAMALSGVLAMWNSRLGVISAWGFLIGVMVYQYQAGQTQAKQATANANPSAQAVSSARNPQIATIQVKKQ